MVHLQRVSDWGECSDEFIMRAIMGALVALCIINACHTIHALRQAAPIAESTRKQARRGLFQSVIVH